MSLMSRVELDHYRKALREVLVEQLAPHVQEHEREQTFDFSTLRSLGSRGLLAPLLPAPWGKGSPRAQEILAEELSYYCAGFALSVGCSEVLFANTLSTFGSEEQKKKYLPGIVSGERIGSWAITELNSGSDALEVSTFLKKEGDRWILTGGKRYITNAPICDSLVTFARLLDENGNPVPGFDGGVALVMDRNMSGLRFDPANRKLGNHSSPTGGIHFDRVELSDENIIGVPGKGFLYAKRGLDAERALGVGMCIGVMQFCFDRAVSYSKKRKQFGKSISEFQLIQEKITEMTVRLEHTRAYMERVMSLLEGGKKITKEAAVLKLSASRWAFDTARDAIQILGAYGYQEANEVERCLRDAKLYEIGAGTSEIQKTLIAKCVLDEFED